MGSCALFFLSLVTDAFQAMLVDHDVVKAENVTRSALFSYKDALREEPKVYVAQRWLHEAGIRDVEAYVASLDELGTGGLIVNLAPQTFSYPLPTREM